MGRMTERLRLSELTLIGPAICVWVRNLNSSFYKGNRQCGTMCCLIFLLYVLVSEMEMQTNKGHSSNSFLTLLDARFSSNTPATYMHQLMLFDNAR